ncbi:hypothetical protein DNTS_003630 [Danionella cerebrum]|uniref:Uncharacterized protein n=1 Tax=Danionella cerebrum TaxID=2873325 RepID=A0A553NRI9_9TELE|nr:hypothetical protein DNTS_003630 [Danionella translucida]TRY68045.1 hypothetical protein DNTS_003630 [Danionella translucida]
MQVLSMEIMAELWDWARCAMQLLAAHKMRTVLPIILFVVVMAGFYSVVSASLDSEESDELSEEKEFVGNITRLQANESQLAVPHFNETRMYETEDSDGENAGSDESSGM